MITTEPDVLTAMKSSPESSTDVITVVIADDHPVVREGLVAIFKSQKDIKVVAEATNGEEALELCSHHLPDVLLLDLRMPEKDGLQFITQLTPPNLSTPQLIFLPTFNNAHHTHPTQKPD